MVSLDDLNDWAMRAAELEWLAEQIGDAVLNERMNFAAELADNVRPIAHLLKKSMVRAGAVDPDASVNMQEPPWPDYLSSIESTPQAQRAAEALEHAALLVLALDKEMGVRGMGETLADFAAELNRYAFKEPHRGFGE
jgi:hypothetical protein